MVNRVILVGNLARDAEGMAGARSPVTRMRLATNHVWRDAEGNRQETSEFHTLVAFQRLAEICATYCLRGRRIYVEGHLRTRDYEGGDGLRRTTTEVIVDTMRLLDRRDHEDTTDLAHVGQVVRAGADGDSAPSNELATATGGADAADETPAAPALSGAAAG